MLHEGVCSPGMRGRVERLGGMNNSCSDVTDTSACLLLFRTKAGNNVFKAVVNMSRPRVTSLKDTAVSSELNIKLYYLAHFERDIFVLIKKG